MVRALLPLGAALLGATAVLAADIPTCSLNKKCPEEAPCCSQYNQCGVGAYCLGGCDPRMSFSLDSCVPAPVCQDKVYKMDSLDRYQDIGEYLGDPSKADWVGQGEPLVYDGNVLLTMPAKSVGTVLATTTYMWYGKVKARMKTSRGAGVVTAFILFSDVKDEIDYEFVGVDLGKAQTNYYFQGIPDYVNGGNITIDGANSYDEFHDYEIEWTPDEIKWIVDGKLGRTKKRSETWNSTSNQWGFPQTPSRVQISIWPGGADTNAKGTVDWAGGAIDWNSEEIKHFGYYFATFAEVSVECYKTDSAPGTHKGVSYYYNNIRGTNDTVVDSNKSTILKSFAGTGTDMNKGDGTSGDPSQSSSVNAIPGGGSSPPNQVPGGSNPGSGSGSGSGSGTGGSGSTGTSGSSACAASGFSQHCGDEGSSSGGNNSNDGARGVDRTLGASAFAVIVGFAGLLLL